MQRNPHIAVIILMAIAVSFFLSGCGGGEQETAATTPAPAAPAAAASATAPAAVGTDSVESTAFSPGSAVPKELTDSLAAKKPVLVFFYMRGPVDDGIVLKAVEAMRLKYGTRVTFLVYFYKETARYGTLADDLRAKNTPSLTIIDGNGIITDQWTGYVDVAVIEQALYESLRY